MTLGLSASRSSSKSSSPAAAVEEDNEPNPELEEPHRTQALKGVEVDTRPERRDVAIGVRPSTGATQRRCHLVVSSFWRF
jgi:hypothetical protein